MEIFLPIVTLLALYGTYLNSIGKKEGFIIWIFTNAVFCFNNFMIHQWEQGLLFLAYILLSIYGLANCLKKETA